MQIIDVPEEFKPRGHVTYPPHHRGPRMEEAHHDYFMEHAEEINTSAIYLPIFWDTYLVDHGFGRDCAALQAYVNKVVDEHRARHCLPSVSTVLAL